MATETTATATAVPSDSNGKTKGKRPDGKSGETKSGENKPGQAGEVKPGETKSADGKPGETKPGEAKTGEGGVTTRPTKPTKPVNPDELKVKPDADGKLRFSFNGQPWPAVLEWVAQVSNMSLDWQELPGDYLNLTTQQSYTVDEVRDLINRHLLARGFTIVQQGEVLSVVNIKKLDPGMLPRLLPADLAKRSPHEFAKVSFTLDWLMAETAVEELKPMLSPHGKLNALKNTNRIEAIDTVGNLREIYAVIKEEQSNSGQNRLVREFVLEHARAEEVRQQLMTLLGVDDKKKSGPKTPEEMQAEQMQQQMQQQMRQQGGQPPPKEKEKVSVNLIVNARKNAILANAPPDKMAIVEQAIKVLDVPTNGGEKLLASVSRMQVYRLAAIEPEPLVTTLNDLGMLDPSTRLQVDKKNRSIIAYASLADHVTIRTLVAKLDGSGRKFEVIQLRKLEADYVAGSIEFMMGGAEKEKPQQRRPFYYDFNPYGGGRFQQEESSSDKFKVDADVENNRLLLWANQIELDEVTNLLAKLGEIPARGGNNNTVRVLQVEPGKSSDETIERIRRAWSNVSPNPLLVPQPRSIDGAPDDKPSSEKPTSTRPLLKSPSENRESRSPFQLPASTVDRVADGVGSYSIEKSNTSQPPAWPGSIAANDNPSQNRRRVFNVQMLNAVAQLPGIEKNGANSDSNVPLDNDALDNDPLNNDPRSPNIVNPNRRVDASRADENRLRPDGTKPGVTVPARREPPPITVTEGPNGELIVTSSDTEALDRFEELVLQMAPERRDFQVFYLKHASAFWVATNLEEYFEIDKKKPKSNDRMSWIFGIPPSQNDKNDTRRLSRRRSLKFITDIDTNTILVQGADPAQLKIIEELVKIYDRPEPADSKAARVTVTFTLKYSKAKSVGEAVKDVYRDLLSSNDKALQGAEQKKDGKQRESQNVYITNLGGEDDSGGRETQVKFKGKLSIGIDELSNTIVVSTEGENLMINVSRMIEALDEAAKPAMATVRVVRMNGQMDSKDVRKAVSRALLDQQPRQPNPNAGQQPFNPNGPFPQQPGQQQPGQGGNNGGGNGNAGGNVGGGP